MSSKPSFEELASRLWEARTVQDVTDILAMAKTLYGSIELRPVGGRPNNIGTIRVASDPGLATIERITNGIDALMELMALLKGGTPLTPRQAAQQWLGLDAGGVGETSQEVRRQIAENLSVVLDDSGEKRRPTVIVEDHGVGQHPDDFPRTLLSLNEDNKVDKPHTMGTYGQGGSATFGFARATIMISRRHAGGLAGKTDRIGWSIVQEIDDPEHMKLPNYSYWAPVGAQGVFELDPAHLPDLEYGTRIIHVAYDLQTWATTYTTGIWQLYNAALFDPVMPFIVGGVGPYNPERKKGDKLSTRVITGNAARLGSVDRARGDVELAHSDSLILELGDDYGSVTINYWVLARESGGDAKDVTSGYVRADNAVSITLFGQRQDQLSRTWIKDAAKLAFIHKQIIVQIDADDLTPTAKRELFSSTRERATESDLRRTIYDHLAETLRDDEELRRLNHLAKERLMERSTAATNDKIRKRLANFIKTKLQQGAGKGVGTGSGQGGNSATPKKPSKPAGVTGTPRKTDDSHLPKVPTHLRFEKQHVRVVQGAQTAFWVEVDAKNGYLDENKDVLQIIWPNGGPSGVKVKSKSRLMGGKSRWYLACEPDTQAGEYKLRAEFMTPNGLLEDTLVVRVVEPPLPKDTVNSGGGDGDPAIDVRWVTKDKWETFSDFGPHTVGRVDPDQETTIIWVNRHYTLLERALTGLTEDQVKVRGDRYQYPVACALWLQHHQMQQVPQDQRPSEDFLNAEHERVAEAVLAAMNADVEAAIEGQE
jgi:hypothetical protein